MHTGFSLQGHRGARGLFPENTLQGIRAARALGLHAIELDVGVTRDGVVVVHHDPALNPATTRGPDGRYLAAAGPLLRDLGFAELQAYDVGRLNPASAYAAGFPAQLPIDGARIPRLADVLALDAHLFLTIELKVLADHPEWTIPPEEMLERVLHVVDAADAAGRIMIECFDWRAPRRLATTRPQIARGFLTSVETAREPRLWWGSDADHLPLAVAEAGGGTWVPEYSMLDAALVAHAHHLRLAVLPWTVNDAASMCRLRDWGVDGLITDRPDLALATLQS